MLLEDLLIQCGVETAPVRGKPNDVLIACPFCTGSHDRDGARKVFGINLLDGRAHCFRCDWASQSVVFTARSLCEAYGVDFSWRLRLSATESDVEASHIAAEPAIAEPVGLPPEYEPFGDKSDEIEIMAWHYLEHRKIEHYLEEYHIGYATTGDLAWRILFPVFGEDGDVYGCAGRDFSGQSKVKYRNTEGIKLLFNGQHEAKRAVVVEGPIDTIRVNRVLKQQFPGTVAVGALGSAITVQQLAQLAKYEEVVQFPDWDAAGVKGAMKRCDACVAAGIKSYVIRPKTMDGSDPGDMSDDLIAECIRSAHEWSGPEKMRLRLSALR